MKKVKDSYLNFKFKVERNKLSIPLIIAFQTFAYGIYIIFHPQFLETQGQIVNVVSYLDALWMGLFFIAIAILYGISSLRFYLHLKRFSAVVIFTLWSFYFLSFLVRDFSGYQTSSWILVFGMLLLINFELRTGEYKR
ncbi:hypothetical protein EP56_07485 [Listeriaceae bacterium FSL A5-0209]|nr:hypothetical protein EP56_07485 [Listeriaceae bacterium FSL A5-0209]